MHDTAMQIGKKFFEIYRHPDWKIAIDCGALDINGSLRSACPDDIVYLGLDLEFGKSVDIKVNIGEALPFRDDFADCVLSSSQMEHDDFFWMTFLEYVRVAKPGGYIYINAPSNGYYHRYPNDNWRFYPDCGHVLVRWAKKNGMQVELVESFIGHRRNDVWNDFTAVFQKGEIARPKRFIADELPCRNVWKYGALVPEKEIMLSEDQDILNVMREQLSAAEQAAHKELSPPAAVLDSVSQS